MTLSENPGAVKKLRKRAWRFQQTLQTPINNLQAFVKIIVESNELQSGSLTIDQVVFEPKRLIELLRNHSIRSRCQPDLCINARGQEQVEKLLEAALSDCVDFVFIPEPKPIVIFADHDEFTTFFANTRSNLNRAATQLAEGGFKTIREYERRL